MSDNNLFSHIKDSQVLAHRGASAYEPENTMKAFALASELGAKWIELDAVLSKDGVPVVFHDETLERMTGFIGNIDDYSYEELSKLKVKNVEKIPTLKEVLELIFANNMRVNVEVKPSRDEFAEITAKKSLEVVNCFNAVDDGRVLFSSFNYKCLEEVRKLSKTAFIGSLVDGNKEEGLICASKLNAVSLHCSNEDATREYIEEITRKKLMPLIYTVNDKKRAEELFSYGVCGVFSDYPDLMKK